MLAPGRRIARMMQHRHGKRVRMRAVNETPVPHLEMAGKRRFGAQADILDLMADGTGDSIQRQPRALVVGPQIHEGLTGWTFQTGSAHRHVTTRALLFDQCFLRRGRRHFSRHDGTPERVADCIGHRRATPQIKRGNGSLPNITHGHRALNWRGMRHSKSTRDTPPLPPGPVVAMPYRYFPIERLGRDSTGRPEPEMTS